MIATQDELERQLVEATKHVTKIQRECGVDVVTDGEVRRENYIHYLCRYIDGISFDELTETSCRNGAYIAHLPTGRNRRISNHDS